MARAKTPISAPELQEVLEEAGTPISRRTAYAILQGVVGLSIDKLRAIGNARPDLATWGTVCWFADRQSSSNGEGS